MPDPHVLSSYVPRLIQRAIAAGEFPAQPRPIHEQAVLLLGDIKGSTGIVEKVGRVGSLAIETLTDNLSNLFADFIDEIYRYDGDVLFIAGDAFLCYWPCEKPHELATITARAVRAGLNIQRKLGNRDDGFGDPLEFRIGIGAGTLTRSFVGGEKDRWELVLSGPAFEQVAKAEKSATPGRVLLSQQAWELVAEEFRAEKKPTGFELDEAEPSEPIPRNAARTPNLEIEASKLTPFLPPAVARRSAATNTNWLAEFRRITVLMVDLPAANLADEAELSLMHQSVRTFQIIVNKFEGSIKVDVDDKGVMLLAVFGVPPLAHEDDAVRALQAGWDLQNRLQSIGIVCGIGIASGRTLCAPLGNDLRREFMVRSDVINRSARLMNATASEVICDDSTYLSARDTVDFEPLPAHMLKGIAETVDVYRPIGMRQVQYRNLRNVIGRERELGQLEAHLMSFIEEGRAETVVVEGEAGLGKTSLLQEFSRNAINKGVRILRARADAIEQNTSYFPWRGVFADLFGWTEDTDPLTRRERVVEGMRRYPELSHLTPLLSMVVGINFEDNAETQHLEGDVRAARLKDLLTSVLQDAMKSRSFCLLIEDAHWFDSQSWDLLVELANAEQPVCIVVATRPTDNSVPDWNDIHKWEALRLSGFGKNEIAQLISQRIGVSKVPQELVDTVLASSGGNPFFSENIVTAMIEDGVIVAEHGVCGVNNVQAFSIPPSVEGMILSRLDRLGELELMVIKTAAIIGQEFGIDAVLQVAELMADRRTESAFANLEASGFIDRTNSNRANDFQFRHLITRDVTYKSLSSPQRIAGHRAFANWIEKETYQDPGNLPLLAHHWHEAGNHEKALSLTEQAADNALFNGSYPEALAFFTRAEMLGSQQSIDPTSRRAARWLKGAGTACYFLGMMDESREKIETAVALLDQPVPTSQLAVLANLCSGLAKQFWYRGRVRGATPADFDKPTYDLIVDSYKILGQLYFLEGEKAEMLAYLTLRGLNVGEVAGPSNAFACILINMSFTAALTGLEGPAEWYAKRALIMTEAGGMRGAAVYVWHIDALRHAQHADWSRALAVNEKAHQLMASTGDFTLATEAAAIRATLTLCTGDLGAAESATQLAKQTAEAAGNEQFYCWALLDEVEIALGKGDLQLAELKLAKALAIETEQSDLSSTLDKLRATALVCQRKGELDNACLAADQIVDVIVVSPPTSYYFLDFYATAVDIHVEALRKEPANRHLHRKVKRELKILRQQSRTFWNVKPRYWLLKGRVLQIAAGDGTAAFEKSCALAREFNSPIDEARALAALADTSVADQKARQQALLIMENLGRDHDVTTIRQLASR